MAVRSATYNTLPAATVLTKPELAFRDIKSVKRSGLGYDIIRTGTPDGRQVLVSQLGSFTFLNPFIGEYGVTFTSEPLIKSEKIHIIWEE